METKQPQTCLCTGWGCDKVGSASDAYSRTVWNVPIVLGVPICRNGTTPFITSPFSYPDIDHESLLGARCQPRVAAVREEHPIKQALAWQKMMEADPALNQAIIADSKGVSRARVCQLMRLLSLAPEIQRVLVNTRDPADIQLLNERRMREIAALPDHRSQIKYSGKQPLRWHRRDVIPVNCDGEWEGVVAFIAKNSVHGSRGSCHHGDAHHINGVWSGKSFILIAESIS